jgi:uncharacterized protein YeaO (DUF488 family)
MYRNRAEMIARDCLTKVVVEEIAREQSPAACGKPWERQCIERSRAMIKVKHIFDRIEADDGPRLWVEPIALTKDLVEWCCVTRVLPHLGPPRDLSEWFAEHLDGYEYFRCLYFDWLSSSSYRPALQRLACECLKTNCTLLHAGDDGQHNVATALAGFIGALEAYCPR